LLASSEARASAAHEIPASIRVHSRLVSPISPGAAEKEWFFAILRALRGSIHLGLSARAGIPGPRSFGARPAARPGIYSEALGGRVTSAQARRRK
jgi:hypothetical protein